MATKLNINKIESYSIALSEKLCTNLFENRKAVSGLDILKLTDIEQVNFFVLKNLFEKWTEEQTRLRSPYFNYEAEEVKLALTNLSNKLSNNIQIEKEFLKPLLIKAITETLHWIIMPQEFLLLQFQNGKYATAQKLKDSFKYFKINKTIVAELVAQASDICNVGEQEVEQKINAILQHNTDTVDDPNIWVERFGNLLSFDISDILSTINKEVLAEQKSAPTIDSTIFSKPETSPPDTEPKLEQVFAKPETPATSPTILNDHFVKGQRTLNEMLLDHKTETASVNDALAETKIHDLRSAISLNKRFEIINDLFRGNTGEYLFAIEDIENANTYNDAIQVLEARFAHKYNWSFDNELLREFLKYIERRFL